MLRKGLQSGCVKGDGEFSVAEVERVQRVDAVNVWIVAAHERFAVDLSALAAD